MRRFDGEPGGRSGYRRRVGREIKSSPKVVAMNVLVKVGRRIPAPIRESVLKAARKSNRGLPGRRIDWGDVARRAPFSSVYGWDRGLPVDRFYIDAFMAQNQHLVTGSVLEVRSPLYARRYGAPEEITVLDIDRENREATLVADLNVPDSLPASAFDCVILTQTLQYTRPAVALRNVNRSLRPGGAALVTVPCLGRIDPEAASVDYWRWTPQGLRQTCEEAGVHATVRGHGNSLAAAACMLGVAAEEIPAGRLANEDPAFPVVACAVIRQNRP
jgi:SAM-dependent methyltransferase